MTQAKVPAHPCEYSPEVIDTLDGLVAVGEHVHDPFAGMGRRLAALCDEVGATYSGTDIEAWPGADPRVRVGDSTTADSYPSGPFTVVTSPVYLNKRLADYANGPRETTKLKGRRDYGISLGRALHQDNLARHTGRPGRADAYWSTHAKAVKHWDSRALVNVDSPISFGWCQILRDNGFLVRDVVPIKTQRYGGLNNAEKRADHEVLIVAEKPVTLCVLSSTPNTIHVVRGPLARLDGGVECLCGRRGLPRDVPWHVTRRCRRCVQAEKEEGAATRVLGETRSQESHKSQVTHSRNGREWPRYRRDVLDDSPRG